MSFGKLTTDKVEIFHSLILEEFHKYRNKHQLDALFIIDGLILSDLIVVAKKRISEEVKKAEDYNKNIEKED